MRVLERNGLLLECTDPTYVRGIHHAWLSVTERRRPYSVPGLIVAHATGETCAAALDACLDDYARYLGHDAETLTLIRQGV